MNLAKISIIIPVFNEAEIIEDSLLRLRENSDIEIIVVDGGSQDNTVTLAQNLGVKVVTSPHPGRANQMNFGASVATGDILLFLHIDTRLPPNFPRIIRAILSEEKIIAGAFQLAINSEKKSLKIIEAMVNLRSHLFSLPYGDQAIFLKASTFQNHGGFPPLPIMEDFVLMRQLKRQGKIKIAVEKVLTSSRRWDSLGVWRTTLINQLIIIGYFLGISPTKLQKLYRGIKKIID